MQAGLLSGAVDQVARRREAGQSLPFELAYALAGEIQLVTDRLERPRLAVEAEAELEDAALALRERGGGGGERVECAADALAAERLLGLFERIRGVAVGEQVAELALVVGADRLVQRDGR